MDEHTKSIHYLLMADHFMVQKALLSQIKDTKLTMGQPKVLDYLKDHDGACQKDIGMSYRAGIDNRCVEWHGE